MNAEPWISGLVSRLLTKFFLALKIRRAFNGR